MFINVAKLVLGGIYSMILLFIYLTSTNSLTICVRLKWSYKQIGSPNKDPYHIFNQQTVVQGSVLDLAIEGSLARDSSRHCVVSFSKTLYPLLSTDSIQEDSNLFRHNWRIVDWDVKHQYKKHNQW